MELWRTRLGMTDIEHLRYLYETCVATKAPVACHEIASSTHSERSKTILSHYVTIHQADGYDELQWYILYVVCTVFDNDADIFWAFTNIYGYQRPYRPIHGERIFADKLKTIATHVKLELCILDNDLCKCLETNIETMLSSVVARWFSTWFAVVGAGKRFYTATIACPAKLRTKWMSLVTARILFDAAGDIPRILARRNDIYRVFFSYRMIHEKELICAAKKRL